MLALPIMGFAQGQLTLKTTKVPWEPRIASKLWKLDLIFNDGNYNLLTICQSN
jgi:hypothetical protein